MTARDIRQALWDAYSWDRGYAIMFEVCSEAGFEFKRRADAVVLDLWPSRGMRLTGMEIKVSRSDLRQELADQSKWKAVGMQCDRWMLVIPEDLRINDIELPGEWGIIKVWNESKFDRWPSTKYSIRTIKQGKQIGKPKRAVERKFLSALFKARMRPHDDPCRIGAQPLRHYYSRG